MKRIYKYQLDLIGGGQPMTWPSGSRVVHVGRQGNIPTLWVEHPDRDSFESRLFVVRGTGHPIEDELAYVGTAVCDVFVWHVYEALKGTEK